MFNFKKGKFKCSECGKIINGIPGCYKQHFISTTKQSYIYKCPMCFNFIKEIFLQK